MSKQGVIPERLGKEKIPVLSSCVYAKAILIPWLDKISKQYDALKRTQLG